MTWIEHINEIDTSFWHRYYWEIKVIIRNSTTDDSSAVETLFTIVIN